MLQTDLGTDGINLPTSTEMTPPPPCVKGALTSSYGPTSLGTMLGATSGVPVPSKCCQMKVLFKGAHSSRTLQGLKLQLTFPEDSRRQQWHYNTLPGIHFKNEPLLSTISMKHCPLLANLCIHTGLPGNLWSGRISVSGPSFSPLAHFRASHKKGLSCWYYHAHIP